jgi:phosphoglycolate phosphatase-like HAD superfamily hydrolase
MNTLSRSLRRFFRKTFLVRFAAIKKDTPKNQTLPLPTKSLVIGNLKAEEVAYIGDSTVDLATARNGDMTPLIFSWGYGTPTDFPSLGLC